MSHRSEDPDLITWLRRLQTRVDKIEMGATRQNSVRVGNVLIEPDNSNDRLTVRNVRTGGLSKFVPDKREVFGWVGTVVLGSDVISPPAKVFDTMTVSEVILEVITPTTTGDIEAALHIYNPKDPSLLNLNIPIILPEALMTVTIPLAVLVHNGNSMYVELIDAGDGTATNMSLTVRFDG